MKLQPPSPAPERILLYGDAGTGKSSAAMSIAHVMGGHMYVVDTDYSASWHRSLTADAHKDVADNVTVRVVGPDDWRKQLAAVREVAELAGPGDWVVLDSATPSWQALQTLYITMKHGDDFFDFFATGGRNDNERADAEINWQAVNGEYSKLYRALFSTEAHLLLTAEADAVGTKDDRKIKVLYETLGFKPKGQKTLAYTPHTVLMTSKSRGGEYRITTVKDRERQVVEGMQVAEFGRDYLMKLARWRPAK